MAVFVAASDEATDGTTTGQFLLGGWVAREPLWYRSFTPMWQRRVLNGPPKIPYLHMVEIKSPKWRAEHGMTDADAEGRLDAAFDIIDGARGLFPITYRIDAGEMQAAFADLKLHIRTEGGVARKKWEPDYLCFCHYALEVLNYVRVSEPDAEKVDFVIERNGPITKHLQRFHRSMAKSLRELERDDLASLVGELIPGGKDRVPLQVADLLCWYTQASEAGTLNRADGLRYARIAGRKGFLQNYGKDKIIEFAQTARDAIINIDDEDD